MVIEIVYNVIQIAKSVRINQIYVLPVKEDIFWILMIIHVRIVIKLNVQHVKIRKMSVF